jgi:Tol biopolymer transport system component
MLTARQTFPIGENVPDTLAGILAREPDWQGLPVGIPSSIRQLLERCLRKDVRRRLRDIGDARIELEEGVQRHLTPDAEAPTPMASRRREYALGALVALLLSTTVALALTVRALLPQPGSAPTIRFEVLPPNGTSFLGGPRLSPDGRTIAFVAVANNQAQIWVRQLDASDAHALPSTQGLNGNGDIFWSADSQFIGFAAEGTLKRVAATGGPSQLICDLPSGYTGGTWNADGVILLGGGPTGGSLLQLSAGAGKPAAATELDASQHEVRHAFPNFLPDGRHFLFVAESEGAGPVAYIGVLNSRERHPLRGIASEVKYSASGHVVFVRDGSLMAQRFSVERFELSGEPFAVAELGLNPVARSWPYSLSTTGALAYRAFPRTRDVPNTQLAWFDRTGKQLALVGPSGDYRRPSLSADDHYVAFERGAPTEIWIMDIRTGVTSRLTSRPGVAFPTWSPDNRRIAFTDNVSLFERAVGVVGEDQLLLKTDTPIGPTDWSRNGRYILFNPLGPPYDLWALPLFGDRKALRLTQTPWSENGARVSPDGHWIAYQSSESPPGTQLYIQSFPERGKKQQVSANGANIVRWSKDGGELFYVSPDLTLTAVSVRSTGSSLEVGAPTPLFKAPIDRRSLGNGRSYDVAADGRFLINVAPSSSAPAAVSVPMTVILNWSEELKQRVPTR